MNDLPAIARTAPNWSLDELVQVANQLLPQFLPEDKAHSRVREDVNPRLIRHYTSQGLLDEPLKEGREARYIYRHLLQVLLVRRLLAEGYGASAIDQLARSQSNTDLENLLQGGVQLTVTPANPALTYLQQLQQRSASSPSPLPPPLFSHAGSQADQISPPPAPEQWTRIEILPGLELHLRSDFNPPSSSQEQQTLLRAIAQHLFKSMQKRRSAR